MYVVPLISTTEADKVAMAKTENGCLNGYASEGFENFNQEAGQQCIEFR